LKRLVMMVVTICGLAAAQAQSPSAEPSSAATRLHAAKPDIGSVNFNLESVEKLIESSSAARQIEAGHVPAALEKRNKAREIFKSAQRALETDDLAKASQLLSDARSLFFEAVRLSAPEEVTAKKLQADYQSRLDSVNALLGAYKRVASEKASAPKGVHDTVALIEGGVAQASRLAQANRYRDARLELDRVYLVAKASISNLRSGDTLVRSLNFASKEEEFTYEVDRNNTHQMLIEVLASDKRTDGMILKFIDAAKELRIKAELAAKNKDYAAGVKLLEESTSELVRAIRSAGIYIPG
jgi:hypothetical protein